MAEQSPSERIDALIESLGGWRADTMTRIRSLVHEAVPDVEETWKWGHTPVFERHGILCTLEPYQAKIKVTFHKGAQVADPDRLFTFGHDGKARRGIDLVEGDQVDAATFTSLVQRAAEVNGA